MEKTSSRNDGWGLLTLIIVAVVLYVEKRVAMFNSRYGETIANREGEDQ